MVICATCGCSDDSCDIVGEEDFCDSVENEDWGAVQDAIADFVGEVHEQPECASGYDDQGWNEFREIPFLDEWLDEKECVESTDNLVGILESYPELAQFCVNFRVGQDLVGATFLVEMSYPLEVGAFSFLEGSTSCEGL